MVLPFLGYFFNEPTKVGQLLKKSPNAAPEANPSNEVMQICFCINRNFIIIVSNL